MRSSHENGRAVAATATMATTNAFLCRSCNRFPRPLLEVRSIDSRLPRHYINGKEQTDLVSVTVLSFSFWCLGKEDGAEEEGVWLCGVGSYPLRKLGEAEPYNNETRKENIPARAPLKCTPHTHTPPPQSNSRETSKQKAKEESEMANLWLQLWEKPTS